MRHDSDTGKTSARPVCSILQGTSAQGNALLCSPLGRKPQGEHGAALRRFAEWYLQTLTVEMLHRGLPKEKGNLRGYVQRQDCASPVFQLHASALREDVHSGQLFVYQGQRNALRNRQSLGLLSEGVSELAAALLCYAPGYQGLLHAHCQNEAAGACDLLNQEDGYTPYQQTLFFDLVRCSGRKLYLLAYRGNCNARPSRELHHRRRSRELDRARSRQEYDESHGWYRTPNRQPHKSTVQQCVSESIRSVCQTHIKMQVLWQICGRWYLSQSRQRMAAVAYSSDTEFPQKGIRIGSAHGQTAAQRGTQGCRVLGSVHQTLQDIYITEVFGAYKDKDRRIRLYKYEKGSPQRKQLSGYIPAYSIVQYTSRAVYERRISPYRCV